MLTRITSLVILTAFANMSFAGVYLGPTPYTSFNNSISGASISPFATTSFNYFHLENFEDGSFNVPGVSLREFAALDIATSFSDSVDGDDGTIDGFATGSTRSLFADRRTTSFTFDFSSSVLGVLPTHAGIVWTDVGRQAAGGGNPSAAELVDNTFFEAFGPGGQSLGLQGPFSLGDAVINRTTSEDRFLGIVNLDGISAIRISMPGKNNWEVDHLQYGSVNAVPEPGSMILLVAAITLLATQRLNCTRMVASLKPHSLNNAN